MSLVLFIDSSERDRLLVALRSGGRTLAEFRRPSRNGHAQTLLPLIDAALKRAKKTTRDLERIIVVKGPGPFTAVRVGVTVANALGWALQIPVLGILKGNLTPTLSSQERGRSVFRPVMPIYGGEPNITVKKKMEIRKLGK